MFRLWNRRELFGSVTLIDYGNVAEHYLQSKWGNAHTYPDSQVEKKLIIPHDISQYISNNKMNGWVVVRSRNIASQCQCYLRCSQDLRNFKDPQVAWNGRRHSRPRTRSARSGWTLLSLLRSCGGSLASEEFRGISGDLRRDITMYGGIRKSFAVILFSFFCL